jgi:hypothetical protein
MQQSARLLPVFEIELFCANHKGVRLNRQRKLCHFKSPLPVTKVTVSLFVPATYVETD